MQTPIVSRTLMGGCALTCFALAFALTPSDVRSQRNPPSPGPPVHSPSPSPAEIRPVAPLGDAFAPRSFDDDDAPAVARLAAPAVPGLKPPLPLVPARVTAIATGSRPTAIVETDSGTRAVSAGDALSGSRVSSILDDAVVLDDGRRLPLDPTAAGR